MYKSVNAATAGDAHGAEGLVSDLGTSPSWRCVRLARGGFVEIAFVAPSSASGTGSRTSEGEEKRENIFFSRFHRVEGDGGRAGRAAGRFASAGRARGDSPASSSTCPVAARPR